MALVPSPGLENCLSALDRLLAGKRSVSVAVAFVSRAGVGMLAPLFARHSSVRELTVVARGAPITDPEALLMLQEEFPAAVSVVAGDLATAFHPKLWLLRDDECLHVISGSGNLTKGGLETNREQFEVLAIEDSAQREAQERRFAELTADAIPLEEMVGSIAWREWKAQLATRERLERELQRLDERLAASPARNMEEARQALLEDLWRIHDLTVAEKLPKQNGEPYNPSGFRLELEGHRGGGGPVQVVGRLCRQQTKGFDVILASDRWELTVESLVVDPNKPYHEFFRGEISSRSEERLRQFPSWPGPPPLKR